MGPLEVPNHIIRTVSEDKGLLLMVKAVQEVAEHPGYIEGQTRSPPGFSYFLQTRI